MANKALRKKIEQDLTDQLVRNNTVGEYYSNLIKDYMAMWDTKNQLIEDIKVRGVTVDFVTAAGSNKKRNESVGELVKLNAQMLKLLDALGIKPSQNGGEVDEL